MDDVLPKPGLLSLPPNGEGDLWRSAVVAPDGDGLLPKRPVGCVNEAGAVGGAPKPPKAGVALEAKMLGVLVLLDVGGFAKIFEVLVVLDGAGLAKMLEVLGLLDGARLPNRLVLLDGAALPKRLELFVLLGAAEVAKMLGLLALVGAAILEPKRPVPGVVKIEVEPNPPPFEGRSKRLPVDVLGAGAGVAEEPKACALLVGAGLEPNKPVADPNPPAPAVFVLLSGTLPTEAAVVVDSTADALLVGAGLEPNKPAADPNPPTPAVFEVVFGTLLAEAGVVVDPKAEVLLVGAGLDPNKAPPATFELASEVLLAEVGLVLPKPPALGAVAVVEALAEAGRVKLRKGFGEVVAVAVVELEVGVVLAGVVAVPNENGLLVVLAEFGVGFKAEALVAGTGALPLEENKLEAGVGALFAEAGRTAVLPVVAVLPGGAAVAPKSPPAGSVVVVAKGAAVGAAVAGCGGGRGDDAGEFP